MKKTRPEVIFFDLDHTLWDYRRNAHETMIDLHANFLPYMDREVSYDDFITTYMDHNVRLWKDYRENKIDSVTLRKLRWHLTCDDLQVTKGDWVDQMGDAYADLCPRKPHLMPNTIEVLDRLKSEYELHLITNGFMDIQTIKVAASGLEGYFGEMITPDHVEVKKPDPKIFEFAMQKVGVQPDRAIHIGDNYDADVRGALGAGVAPVFYNPENKENPDSVTEIKDLLELTDMLL